MARVSNQQVAQEFEVRVRSFLETLGLSDVQGGPGFKLGENQIDACAGFEDTLLIVECKTGNENKKSLLVPVRILRGQMESIKQGIAADPTYKKYKEVRFVIAAKFNARPEDKAEGQSQSNQTVHIWDDDLLTYYERLCGKIDSYAKFNLLGELGVKPRVEHTESFPCLSLPFSKKVRGFIFFAEPQRVLKCAYVARRETGREHYYQRIVESKKLNEIKKYIGQGHYFPNAVILAFNVKPQFKEFPEVKQHFPTWGENLEFGSISFPSEYRSCWIIDGQHRLYGIGKSGVNAPIPIVALENVEVADQAQLFLDINKNQKPVPSDLVWDLEGEMRPNEPDGIIARVVKEINAKGILSEKIYIPLQGPKLKDQLKLSGICAAIAKQKLNQQILKDKVANPLYSADPDQLVKNISSNLKIALEELDKIFTPEQKAGFWLQNSGLSIFLAIFERIIGHLRQEPKRSDFEKYLGALKTQFDSLDKGGLRELRQSCSSEGGRDAVVRKFVFSIRSATGEESFGGSNMPQNKFEKRIGVMEKGLRELLASILVKEDTNWFKTRVHGGIWKKIEPKIEKGTGQPQNEMSFGEVCETMSKSDNWPLFKTILRDADFHDEADFRHAMLTVNRLRADVVHEKRKLPKPDEFLLEGFLGKFEKAACKNISP
jgi:DNA sulfur modification protein DndB